MWSGLVLAGGNNTWNGNFPPENVEDGILTAEEISRLDLSNTDLVVLSACETARGHIDPLEGVWGLQRAFKLAGAKTILMTLWKVSDEITAMFMEEFYQQLLNGKSVRQSVKEAQDYLIQNGASDPFYWAPFVVLD
jgi:CHAT domain-containing protein